MPDPDIRHRIEARVAQGQFLGAMLQVAHRQSGDVHGDFVANVIRLASAVRRLLEENGLLRRLAYQPESYWPGVTGSRFAFIDGGVAAIDLPSAAPVGIRVGSYLVRPGDESSERERFDMELSLVDDLFSDTGVLFDDDFSDVAKLRDAARMASEVAAAYRICAREGASLTGLVLHGPLVNPAAPYGLAGFPPFGLEACRLMLNEADWAGDERDRSFVSFYRTLLERLRDTGVPVVGAVERSIGRDPVVLRRVLGQLVDKREMKERDARDIEAEVIRYGLNDASLLDVVLGEGEYIAPIPVDRQGPPNKWPDDWRFDIQGYPRALTTYIKPSESVTPFRIEGFEAAAGFDTVLDLVFHTSRLLPSYGFPVGLDIVDRFAKVPAWLSRSVKGQHQVVLLRKAIESGDPGAIAFAKRVLAAKGRDWLFRPTN